MADFDFIADPDLRQALEADYAELDATVGASAWKAAHVMAGSVIEAVLVYYLIATDYQARTSQDPLRMSFDDLIGACKRERILSEKAAELTTVVKRYRNLIHPGRVRRLEENVDQASAGVARALVDMIIKEVGATSKKILGYTAEQLLSKVESDQSAISILDHLLAQMNPYEVERLITTLLPPRYYELLMTPTVRYMSSTGLAELHRTLASLKTCFRAAFDVAKDEAKAQAAGMLVETIKKDGQERVYAYEAAFLMGKDLRYLEPGDAKLVKQHLLSRILSDGSLEAHNVVQMLTGIGVHLTEDDDIFGLVSDILSRLERESDESAKRDLAARVWSEYWDMKTEVQQRFRTSVVECRDWYAAHDRPKGIEVAEKLNEDLEFPF